MTEVRKFCLKKDTKEVPKYVFASAMRKLPAQVDLRPTMPKVYDQHSIGSCTANALGAAFEYNMICKREIVGGTIEHEPFTPSRLFIYYNEREMEGTTDLDVGASLENGVLSMKKIGVCNEEHWPYIESKFAEKPPTHLYDFALSARVATYRKMEQNLHQLREALYLGYPISFGMQIFESFEKCGAASGHVDLPRIGEDCLGGHAVLIVGYDHDRRHFIVRNSWGEKWGDGGHFYMPYEYVLNTNLCSDFWVLLMLDA